jgi:hypothetical protein
MCSLLRHTKVEAVYGNYFSNISYVSSPLYLPSHFPAAFFPVKTLDETGALHQQYFSFVVLPNFIPEHTLVLRFYTPQTVSNQSIKEARAAYVHGLVKYCGGAGGSTGKTVKICDLRIDAKKMKDLQEGKDTEDQQGSSQGDVDSGKQSRSVTSG